MSLPGIPLPGNPPLPAGLSPAYTLPPPSFLPPPITLPLAPTRTTIIPQARRKYSPPEIDLATKAWIHETSGPYFLVYDDNPESVSKQKQWFNVLRPEKHFLPILLPEQYSKDENFFFKGEGYNKVMELTRDKFSDDQLKSMTAFVSYTTTQEDLSKFHPNSQFFPHLEWQVSDFKNVYHSIDDRQLMCHLERAYLSINRAECDDDCVKKLGFDKPVSYVVVSGNPSLVFDMKNMQRHFEFRYKYRHLGRDELQKVFNIRRVYIPFAWTQETPPPLDQSWFKTLFGFDELIVGPGQQVTEQVTKHLTLNDSDPNNLKLICKHQDFNYKYDIGKYELASLGYIISNLQKHANFTDASKRGGSWGLKYDIIIGSVEAFHRRHEMNGALFQAASQFNSLEMVKPEVIPESGVTGYVSDKTQGPACALSCPTGTIFRNYFGLPSGGKMWGGKQTKDNQIDTLSELHAYIKEITKDPGPFWTTQNGYLTLTDDNIKLEKMKRMLEIPLYREEAASRIKFSVHSNIPVCYTNGHKVHQIYTSAIPIAYTGARNNDIPEVHKHAFFAKFILNASYIATLATAALYACERFDPVNSFRQKVVITSIGGGVFNNHPNWINDAIKNACNLFRKLPLDVQHNFFNPGILTEGSPSHQVIKLFDTKEANQRFTGNIIRNMIPTGIRDREFFAWNNVAGIPKISDWAAVSCTSEGCISKLKRFLGIKPAPRPSLVGGRKTKNNRRKLNKTIYKRKYKNTTSNSTIKRGGRKYAYYKHRTSRNQRKH